MMRELLGEEVSVGEDNGYEQMAMDVSTLEYGRSIDAMNDGYEQIEMSVMHGQLNTPEMMKRQVGVTTDTIYMGSIGVYPSEEKEDVATKPNYNQGYGQPIQMQPYYDPTTGMMYVYPVYNQPMMQGYIQSVHQPMLQGYTQPVPQPVIQPVVQPMAQPIPKPVVQPVQQPVQQPHVTKSMTAPVTQETTMYPATSVTKMVDIFGEDKKYSKALMELQAESEYKVALHANAGKNGKRYMYNFSHMDKTRQLLNWNWGAFLFGPLWYAYRKMPIRAFFLLIALLFGLSTPYAMAVATMAPLLVGAFSDKIYKNRLDYMIDRQFSMNPEAKQRHIVGRGGTSMIYVVMFILITTVIAIGTYVYVLPEVEVLRTTWGGLIIFLQNVLGLY